MNEYCKKEASNAAIENQECHPLERWRDGDSNSHPQRQFSLTGFAGGLQAKQMLLSFEGRDTLTLF